MAEPAIRVEGLGKRYRIGARKRRSRTLSESLTTTALAPARNLRAVLRGQAARHSKRYLWAVEEVSFDVPRGQVLGIIGRNGAGKSTLLKMLSRITEPTCGWAEIRGRVGSLLEVGTGFHPELSGRENVYLNGAILGMRSAEIRKTLDRIVAFAEVERMIDTPVKHYSSGMMVRLAFSVAAHLETEVLLVDEVLAVGDVAFQRKCLGKMGEVARKGRTVVFVSHNMAAIESFSDRILVIEDGRLVHDDTAKKSIRHYLDLVLEPYLTGSPLADREDRTGTGSIRLTEFRAEALPADGDPDSEASLPVRSGADAVLALGYECAAGPRPRNVDVGFSIHTLDGATLLRLYSSYMGQDLGELPEVGEFRCLLEDLPLAPGKYLVHARVTVGGEEADWPRNGVGFLTVEPGDFFGTGRNESQGRDPALILQRGTWSVAETERP